jgi:hypothetical protein
MGLIVDLTTDTILDPWTQIFAEPGPGPHRGTVPYGATSARRRVAAALTPGGNPAQSPDVAALVPTASPESKDKYYDSISRERISHDPSAVHR